MTSKSQLFETVQTDTSSKETAQYLQRKTIKWTPEEDKHLLELIAMYGKKNWKKIAEMMKRRNAVQCLHRWSKILQPGLVKGPWTLEEDKILIDWVSKHGPMKWSSCSELIPGRSGKQCRERWYNNLDPKVVKGNWTAKEDYKIFKLFERKGSQWSKIACCFRGRTENSIKNRFYCTLRRIANKYSGMDTSNYNLDELLGYFRIALQEKENEMNKEINNDNNNKDDFNIETPFLNYEHEQMESEGSYITNKTNSERNMNNNELYKENECSIENYQMYYLKTLMNLCIERNNFLINYLSQEIIIRIYYNQLVYLLLKKYYNSTFSI